MLYDAIAKMEPPKRPVPDYEALSRDFTSFVFDPANGVRHDEPFTYFNAYSAGKGCELVTWGILAVGEAIFPTEAGAKINWDALWHFYNADFSVYTNSPTDTRTEHWYLMYVNALAGAIYRTCCPSCPSAKNRMISAANTLRKLAQNIGYDFNSQGYDFIKNLAWTNKNIYRQPDSIGGYAYNMLFAGIHGDMPEFIEEAKSAIARYGSFEANPWYEIPNGSTAVLAAAWLKAQGWDVNLEKILGFVFDPKAGPLQTGRWNGHPVDGLMMGWRGDDRQSAMASAYSMETLMPIPFMLPAVRYAPEIAKPVAWYALQAVTNFVNFYGKGMYETRPDLSSAVPYEKLERERDGHSPAACGDFHGHRSVYGGGYMPWMAAIVRPTGVAHMPAFDISLTDFLCKNSPKPAFLLYNHENKARKAVFTPAPFHKINKAVTVEVPAETAMVVEI
ncbi:MAG: hypothetical protein FWC77_04675 [Defluviitaleaceae bacterium]|nr:hypothetical protein [Defluviitaleaceae bacterium]